MAYITQQQRALLYYDPFNEEKIDPAKGDSIYDHLELPSCIHDAVRRAKLLVGESTREALYIEVRCLRKMLLDGEACATMALDETTDRDYVLTQEPDSLRAYLEDEEHDIPVEQWPALFGLLALANAGEIYNTLWPSEALLAKESVIPEMMKEYWEECHTHEAIRDKTMGLAIEAVRAAGFGEGMKAALYELRTKEKNRSNAKNTHQGKDPLFLAYIDWALALGPDHTYRYQSHAEKDFLADIRENNPKLAKLISENSELSLRRRLKKHCNENDIPHPFPKRRAI